MRVVDLTYKIEENMPVFPGDEPPLLKCFATYEPHGFKETLVSLCSHTGTHIDSPSHVFPKGKPLDDFPLEQFIGKALVIDCTKLEPKQPISLELIQEYGALATQADFLLFHTGWNRLWGKAEYFCEYPRLSDDAIDFILRSNKQGIGMDTAGVDPASDHNLTIHKMLLRQENLILIENMRNLELIGTRLFTLVALPLYLHNADGAPARVIGLCEE